MLVCDAVGLLPGSAGNSSGVSFGLSAFGAPDPFPERSARGAAGPSCFQSLPRFRKLSR